MLTPELPPEIEPELLQQSPPRKVRERGSRSKSSKWAQWIMLPFFALFLGGPLWAMHNIYVLVSGTEVPCEIVDRYIVEDNDGLNHYVVYRVPPPGKAGFNRELVDEASYNQVAVGSQVPLQMSPILPGMSSVLAIPGRDMSGTFLGMIFFIILMLGMGFAIVWFVYIHPILARRLVVIGVPVLGRLVDKITRSSGNDSDEVTGYYLLYEYQPNTHNTAPLIGEQHVSYEAFIKPEIRQQYTVLYNPKKPQRSLLYEFGEYEVGAP